MHSFVPVSYTHLAGSEGAKALEAERAAHEAQRLALGAEIEAAARRLSLIHISMCIRDSIKGKEKVIRELKSLAKESDEVFLATDPDREGEAISWHRCV